MQHAVSNRFFYSAIVFALIGICGGIYMAASHDHLAAPAHAHTLLLGWVSMAVFGFFYRLVPQAARTLANWHWWLMNIGVPVMAIGILLVRYENAAIGEPLAAGSSFVILAAMILFAINVVHGLNSEGAASARA
jgi:hypothetical protein